MKEVNSGGIRGKLSGEKWPIPSEKNGGGAGKKGPIGPKPKVGGADKYPDDGKGPVLV